MSNDTPATLTESELFENFLQSPLDGHGAPVVDFLSGFGTNGLDEVGQYLMDECCDERQTSDPSGNLGLALDELRGLCWSLEKAIALFEEFKIRHQIDSDMKDDEGDDQPVLYRVPALEGEAA